MVFKKIKNYFFMMVLVLSSISHAYAEEIGSVSVKFRFLTPNDKISVEAFDDPQVDGVTCYLSRAKKGGAASIVGMQEDNSEASVSCRQMGPIVIKERLKNGDIVFKKSTSLVFKTIQVVRFFDTKRNALIYLVYSDRLVDGSPDNSISSVPLQKWDSIKPDIRIMQE